MTRPLVPDRISREVCRRWKRDDSLNFMSIAVASENLHRNASDKKIREMDRISIAELLKRGDIIETPLAMFFISKEKV